MRLIPDAREGVQTLASAGSIAYYTARYSAQSEERSEAMAQATRQWLAAYDFVNPTNAIFCDGLPGKLRQLARDIAEKREPTILIDDQYSRLLQKLSDLDEESAQIIKQSLILVAYGAQTIPESVPLPVIALPSWEAGAVHQMLEMVAGFLPREQEASIQSGTSERK